MLLSIVIPVFNEEKLIRDSLKIKKLNNLKKEIILVNDGSLITLKMSSKKIAKVYTINL